jgi:hypothetical protein
MGMFSPSMLGSLGSGMTGSGSAHRISGFSRVLVLVVLVLLLLAACLGQPAVPHPVDIHPRKTSTNPPNKSISTHKPKATVIELKDNPAERCVALEPSLLKFMQHEKTESAKVHTYPQVTWSLKFYFVYFIYFYSLTLYYLHYLHYLWNLYYLYLYHLHYLLNFYYLSYLYYHHLYYLHSARR